jgi:predicted permease
VNSAALEEVLPAFLLLVVGWVLRRRAALSPDGVRGLGRLVVDVCFPALAFAGIARTVSRSGLAAGSWAMVLAVALFVVAAGVGLAAGRFGARGPTVAFLVAMPNWIFLPLPIAPALWGPEAAGTVLLMNLPLQLAIWSAGVAILTAGHAATAKGRLRLVLANPALLASLAGVAAGLVWNEARVTAWPLSIPARAVDLLGGMTVPLSFVVMGAQLAAARLHPRIWGRELGLVLVARLLVAPAVFALAVRFLPWSSWGVPPHVPATALLVAAMPSAVSCGAIVERFGGDEELAAQAVAVSTLLASATVPLVLRLGGVL